MKNPIILKDLKVLMLTPDQESFNVLIKYGGESGRLALILTKDGHGFLMDAESEPIIHDICILDSKEEKLFNELMGNNDQSISEI